jgi:undecaprenyl-diphosphatase
VEEPTRRRQPLAVTVLAAFGIGATLGLGFLAPPEQLPTGWEATILHNLAVDRTGEWWKLALYVRQLGSEHAAIMASVCMTIPLLALGYRRWAAQTFLAVLAGAAGAELSKHLVGRQRGSGGVLAYPSGHTAGATAIAVALAILVMVATESKWMHVAAWTIAAAFSIAVAWANVASNVHYPADVLGGMAFGLCAPLVVRGLFDLPTRYWRWIPPLGGRNPPPEREAVVLTKVG